MPNFKGDVVMKRVGGKPLTNVPKVVTRHSPDGFEWGYTGSGPSDLALNILMAVTSHEVANALYQNFKWEFIANIPYDGGIIKREQIIGWLQNQGVRVV